MGGAALTVGLSISVIGRKMPTLFGGNIMLSLFLGVLMRTSQGNHSDIPQWVFWPPIVWLATFTCMSGCICGAQECLLAILTGIVFSAIGLAIVVAAVLKPIPWGLSAAIALFGFGLVAGLNYVEKLWLAKALIQSGRSEHDAHMVAQEVRLTVAFWLLLSTVMFLTRLLTSYCWEKRNPKEVKQKPNDIQDGTCV